MSPPKVLWICGSPRPVPTPPESSQCIVEIQSPTNAPSRLCRIPYHAVVIDGLSAILHPESFVQEIQSLARTCPVLIRDARVSFAARLGALHIPPEDTDPYRHVRAALEVCTPPASACQPENLEPNDWEGLLVGKSAALCHVRQVIRLVGARRANVLITGETGTGKEIAAKALHQASPRLRMPFVSVNCTALPENLMEAELFGHVRGAFTGAIQNRVGRFGQADGGTLFLDEIGELPLELQAKLLRVLQEREFQRLGSSETIRVDVRIIAATNRDLRAQLDNGRFREDLYYRLNVVPLEMPPLRHRPEDIPLLAQHFVEKICSLEELTTKRLSGDALDRLCRFSWPGNVRQLENAIEMAVALSGSRMLLTAGDFPLPAEGPSAVATPLISVPDQGLDFEQTVAFIERSILEQALRKTGGNKKAAAEMLRLKRTTLSAKVRSLETDAACS